MNKEKNRDKLPLFDIYQAAYSELKGFPSELVLNGTRVEFNLPACGEVYEILREYQTNPQVPIVDYVNILRRLRARMLSKRGQS